MNSTIDLLAFIIISLIVLVDITKNKSKVKFEKIISLRYFHSFIKDVEETVKKNKKLFNIISFISLIISLPTIVLISYFLISSIIKFQPTVALVLPTVSGYKYPGPIISVPFFYWLISIFLIIFFHETMHAIVAMSNDIKVKRYGVIYLLLLPIGAFVDIDEGKLKKSKLTTKIKIYAAGSLGNFLLALVILVIAYFTTSVFSAIVEESGVYFESTIPDSPAHEVNLSGIIVKINDTEIKNIYDLQKFLQNRTVGETVKIHTTKGEYILKLAQKDNRTYIGINNTRTYYTYRNTNNPVNENILMLFSQIFILYRWIFLLSIGVGLANMLPILPLDGGLITKDIMIKFLGKKRGEKISKIISVFFVILIVSSFLLYSKFQLKVF